MGTRAMLLACLLLVFVVPAPTHAAAPQAVFFPQTGHHLDDTYGFLTFWRANGQTARFGLPLSETLLEAGRAVQYFERARFEFEAGGVMLGRLGAESGVVEPAATPDPAALYFVETGHNLRGEFRDYWERHNGLLLFGLPLTEERQEGEQLVQWFERARLEYHPEAMRPLWRQSERSHKLDLDPLGEIVASDLGRSATMQRGIDTTPTPRRDEAPDWSPALWRQSIRVSLSQYTLEAYEDDLRVLAAPIAHGKPGFATVTGTFTIGNKFPQKDMKNTRPEFGELWDVKAVPFVQYFYKGFAIHGTYWHNRFGTRRSHGCVNLPLEQAEWLFSWTTPQQPVKVTIVP